MLVDVHCHLDFQEFDADRDKVVERAKDVLIVNSTVDPELVGKSLKLQETYRNVRTMLGWGASDTDDARFERMMNLIKENRDSIVGVGEVGLDHYWVKDGKLQERQKSRFIEVVELSVELGLPLVVHSRDAEADCINILEERKVRAIMHCFSGTVEEASRAAELGCLISIPANVAYSRDRQTLAEAIPLDSIVLETDAPYLSPTRGQRNEPCNVRVAAETVARIKGVAVSKVEDITTSNALGFIKVKNG